MSGYTAAAKLVALAGEIVLKIHQRIRDARAIRLIQSRADLLQEFLLRKWIKGVSVSTGERSGGSGSACSRLPSSQIH